MPERTVISICGGSGCGKSTLARKLCEHLEADRAVRIPADFFLRSNSFDSLVEFFQHPLVYDWGLVESILQAKDGTHWTSPDFDFIRFQRISIEGGRPFILRPIVVIDAMVPYPGADFFFLLQVPGEIRQRRIEERDRIWGTSVIDYWDLHEITLAEVISTLPSTCLELNGLLPIEENVARMAAVLQIPPG